MKNCCLITRRRGTTRPQFRQYYENSHAPLGTRFYPFRKYVRNHVVQASTEIDFDVITETYFDDAADVAAIDSGEVRATMDVDEKHFMEQGMIRSASVEERVLVGPLLEVAAPGVRRQMLLLRADVNPAVLADIESWGTRLGSLDGVARVSVDSRRDSVGGYGRFPFNAILSLWLHKSANRVTALDAPERGMLDVWIVADVCETTTEEFKSTFDVAAPSNGGGRVQSG